MYTDIKDFCQRNAGAKEGTCKMSQPGTGYVAIRCPNEGHDSSGVRLLVFPKTNQTELLLPSACIPEIILGISSKHFLFEHTLQRSDHYKSPGRGTDSCPALTRIWPLTGISLYLSISFFERFTRNAHLVLYSKTGITHWWGRGDGQYSDTGFTTHLLL